MNILALEASGSICSVALEVSGKIYSREKNFVRSHSQFILPMIEGCLAEAQIQLKEIDVCAYGKGPGSFTGLRLVTAIVQGFSYVHHFSVLGISTLQLMAQHIFENTHEDNIVVCEDARMNEVYFGHYCLKSNRRIEQVSPEACLKPEEVINQLNSLENTPSIFGSGVDIYPAFDKYPKKINYEPLSLAPVLISVAKTVSDADLLTGSQLTLPSYIRKPVYQKRK